MKKIILIVSLFAFVFSNAQDTTIVKAYKGGKVFVMPTAGITDIPVMPEADWDSDPTVGNVFLKIPEPAAASGGADWNTNLTNIPTPVQNLTGTNTGDQDLTGKQDNLTLTTTGTSGAATLTGGTLNIPDYASTVDQTLNYNWTGESRFSGSFQIGNASSSPKNYWRGFVSSSSGGSANHGGFAVIQPSGNTKPFYGWGNLSTGVDVGEIKADGDIELKIDDAGLILSSADGTRYKLTVSNAGALVITAL